MDAVYGFHSSDITVFILVIGLSLIILPSTFCYIAIYNKLMIREHILINKEYYGTSSDKSSIDRLSRMNIFVGANNSGKSRLIRSIYSANESRYVNTKIDHRGLNASIKEYLEENKAIKSLESYKILLRFINEDGYNKYYERSTEMLSALAVHANDINRQTVSSRANKTEAANLVEMVSPYLDGVEAEEERASNTPKIYTPVLRGARLLGDTGEDYYRQRTEEDYGLSGIENGEVFTGHSIFSKLKSMLLGSKEDRNSVREFESFISRNFFPGLDITLVPNEENGYVKIDMGDSSDLAIHDVGDGIQSIIINTFPVFMSERDDVMLFIEEPELLMHPSMQRVLIKTYLNEFPNLQVFLSTHSNHFLDIIYDYPEEYVSIYSVAPSKESKGKKQVKYIRDNMDVINLLGVRNSSVLLANSVIWVEGVTDRLFIRFLMESYLSKENFIEDYDYAISEYGGGNLVHFDFGVTLSDESINVSSISRNNLLIMDNDLAEENTKKKENQEALKKHLGSSVVIDYPEIENLVPASIWHAYLVKISKGRKWLKLKDNINFEKFDEELNQKRIGSLIKEHMLEEPSEEAVRSYKNESIDFLSIDKRAVMKGVIEVLIDKNLPEEKLPATTIELLSKIKIFINKYRV